MADLVLTANEIRVVINGVEVELAQDVRMSDTYAHEGASGIGDGHVQEFVPTLARHTATMSKLVMPAEDAIRAGIINENMEDAMRGREFDIEVFSQEGPLIRKLIGAVNDGGDIAFRAHRMVMTDATFLARDAKGTYAIRA